MAYRDLFDISGKVALVTGGGSGIGRVLCEAMAEFGADVACVDINRKGAEETVERIRKFGHRTLVVEADVTKPDEVEGMISETVAELSNIDIQFNNAGIVTFPARIHEITIENWDRVMAVNLKGVFLCMRAVLPIMMSQKRGCIINIASVAGLVATVPELQSYGNYNASKAGVINLTKQGAVEYADYGIRVNAIAPNLVAGTNQATWRTKWSGEMLDRYNEVVLSRVPMKRRSDPADLKGVAVYLASNASSYVTGQTFVVDGGLMAW